MTSTSVTSFLRLHAELVSRERIRTSLIDWATDVMMSTGLTPAAHHRFLLNNLDQITEGKIKRLLVLMPPGSAKSTYTSVNSDLWGQYVPAPPTPGSWYAWAEGTDGSTPTAFATSFTVT
jgi:hypothetical protein